MGPTTLVAHWASGNTEDWHSCGVSVQENDESRWLAGQRTDRDGTKVEYIRRLSEQEMSALNEAESFLTQLTTDSTHQRMVERYEAFGRAALYAQDQDLSEAAADRTTRMGRAFRAFLQAAVARRAAASAPGAQGSLSDSAAWLAAENLARGCRLIIGNGPNGKQVGVISDKPADVPPAPQPVYAAFLLAHTLLQDSELLQAHTLLGAAEAVDEASLRFRMLAAEVPLGTPLIMGEPPRGQTATFQVRILPIETATRAQQAVRNARELLTAAGTPEDAGRQGADEAVLAPDQGALPLADQAEPPAQLDGDGDAGEEQGATWTSDAPLFDLSQLARHLATEVSVVEQLWSDAVPLERLQEAASEDRARFGAVAGAVLRATERAEQPTGPAAQLQHGFPLPAHVVGALPLQPADLPAALDGVLYGLTSFLDMLDQQALPTEVDADPEGQVLRVLFQPGATGRIKGHALLLARCIALVDDLVSGGGGIDEQAEEQRLADAALDAWHRGQPEAALLYTNLALTARGTRQGVRQQDRVGDLAPPVVADSPVVPMKDLADNATALLTEMLSGVPAIRLLPTVLATAHILVRHLREAQDEETVCDDGGHHHGGDQDEDRL